MTTDPATAAMIIAFWFFAGLSVYPYLLYPPLLWFLARLWGRQSEAGTNGSQLPTVTIVISAHNEEAVIEEKIVTTLAGDYPADKLQVLVVSDASTDDTNAIVTALSATKSNVRLLELVEHKGKTAGLNIAMESIDTEVVIFTDANAIFESTAVRRLVDRLSDPAIGYVVGAQLYTSDDGNAASENEGLYWRYELALKNMESTYDSVVGGDGAIYAVRRELFEPLAAEDINDFVNPLQVISRGYRGVFCEGARAYEDAASDFGKEFRRKRRIVCRSWGALLRYASSLRLHRYPRFYFMLLSHKVIRWFTTLWVALAVCINGLLVMSGASVIYLLTLILALLSFALAAMGHLAARDDRDTASAFSVPYYFYLSNLAALMGIIDYARGNRYVTWQHVRSP